MNFEKRKSNGVTIFRLNEKKLDANISGLVKAEFNLIVRGESVNKLVVDLSSVETCDSSGLSSLLVANRLIGSVDGEMRIVSPSEKVMQLINITQLHRVLSFSNSVEEAIKELEE